MNIETKERLDCLKMLELNGSDVSEPVRLLPLLKIIIIPFTVVAPLAQMFR